MKSFIKKKNKKKTGNRNEKSDFHSFIFEIIYFNFLYFEINLYIIYFEKSDIN
jgi:hypothetical protein